ncbi:hypothetical protein, partial [Escherichia coli]|uniref:hypothetical protein n=1 Tax=Escherichia coli TaxID=562 RepID=UPI002019F1B1
ILGSGYNTMISHLGLIRTFPEYRIDHFGHYFLFRPDHHCRDCKTIATCASHLAKGFAFL